MIRVKGKKQEDGQMKQLIVALGLALLGLSIFRMMTIGDGSLLGTASRAIEETREYYICTN